MTSDDLTMVYAGSLPCRCIVAVTVDKPEYQRENAKDIAAWMRQGMVIDHRTVAAIKADPLFLHNCGGEYHRSKAKQSPQMGAGL